MKVAELRAELASRGLDTKGKKAELEARLQVEQEDEMREGMAMADAREAARDALEDAGEELEEWMMNRTAEEYDAFMDAATLDLPKAMAELKARLEQEDEEGEEEDEDEWDWARAPPPGYVPRRAEDKDKSEEGPFDGKDGRPQRHAFKVTGAPRPQSYLDLVERLANKDGRGSGILRQPPPAPEPAAPKD
jgi:hypothetical protein